MVCELSVQTSRISWAGGRSCRSIPTSRFGGLWIDEGFCGFDVRFTHVRKGGGGLAVLFLVDFFLFNLQIAGRVVLIFGQVIRCCGVGGCRS